jgi:hypothetical protein
MAPKATKVPKLSSSFLCRYKDNLGKPNEGIHKYRIFNIAIVDVIMTLIGAYIIAYFINYSFGTIAILLFLLGIFLHRLFCVRTTVDKWLF